MDILPPRAMTIDVLAGTTMSLQPDATLSTTRTLMPYVRRHLKGRLDRREVQPITLEAQRCTLRSFAESFGQRIVKNMSQSDIERWMVSRRHVAASTLRKELSDIRVFTHWLQEQGVIKRDPMVHVKSPRVPRSVPRALDRTETEALEAVLPDARARAIVALMLDVGLRRVEVIRLQTGSWNRTDRTLRVVGKGGHERIVPITDEVGRVLGEYVGGMTWGPMIRRNDRVTGITDNYVSRMMRGWMEEAGVKIEAGDGKACHSLRHTCASELADAEPDLRVTQELLGHADLGSTQVYLRHAGLGRIRAAMELANPTDGREELTLDEIQTLLAGLHDAVSKAGRGDVAQRLLRSAFRAIVPFGEGLAS
jgi:site-specific recombinase XerD